MPATHSQGLARIPRFLNFMASLAIQTVRAIGYQRALTSKKSHENTEYGPIIESKYAISLLTSSNARVPNSGNIKIPKRTISAKMNCRKPRKNFFMIFLLYQNSRQSSVNLWIT